MPDREATPWSPSYAELARALEREEFVVHYQPIVAAESNRMVGAEALVRWQHPERGLLRPGAFVQVAEATDLGLRISEWVQRAACQQVQAWARADLDPPIVSINLTPIQARPHYLGPHLRSMLDDTGVAPQHLAIEMHEDFFPAPALARSILAELADVGIPLWLDDFGTGSSPLSYLDVCSVLKLDRSYVIPMLDSLAQTRIVTGLIAFAHHLRLRVIAEGVVSAAHHDLLREHGCDMVQGGYFCLPVPVDTITAVLESGGVVTPNEAYVD